MIGVALGLLITVQEHKQPQGPPEEKKPAVDRSGEPALRKLLSAYGKRRDFAVLLIRGTRESETSAYAMESTIELRYRGPGTFRVESSSIWSDGRTFVADGRALLVDPLETERPVVLRDLKPGLAPNDTALALGGEAFSPYFWLLDGEGSLEQWAAPDGFIREGRLGAMRHVIQTSSRGLGTIWITYRDRDTGPVVSSIAWDGAAKATTPFTLVPMSAASADFVAALGDAGRSFSTIPEPGIQVDDRRAKKKVETQAVERPSGTLRRTGP